MMQKFIWGFASLTATMMFLQCNDARAIIGGEVADEGLWPGTLFLKGGNGLCTATVIGRRVLLTAAHCVSDSETLQAAIENYPYNITCAQHPDYPSDVSADFALCSSDKPMLNVGIERLNTDRRTLANDATVTVAGYGCALKGGTDQSFGVLRTGRSVIWNFGSKSDNDYYITTEGAAPCFGDAGAGLYSVGNTPGSRALIGVSSRSDLAERGWFSSVSAPAFVGWAKTWAHVSGLEICGLSDDEASCEPTPSPADVEVSVASDGPAANDVTLSRPPSKDQAEFRLNRLRPVSHQAGESVQSVVERTCGPQSQAYYDILHTFSADILEEPLAKDSVLRTAGDIEIPYCTRGQTLEIRVTSGKSLWNYFRSISAQSPTDTWAGYERPGEQSSHRAGSAPFFIDIVKALNPEIGDLASLKAGTSVIVPTSPSAETGALSDLQVGLPDDVTPEFTVETQAAADECKSLPTDPVNYPYDISTLLDVLMRNRERHDDQPRNPVWVMVADSGLYAAGRGIFNWKILPRQGLTPEQYASNLLPQNKLSNFNHGTQVSSLVLGGPIFSRLNALQGGGQAPIILDAIKIYVWEKREFKDPNTGHSRFGMVAGVDPNAFELVTQRAKSNADIVNLSLKTTKPINAIQDHYLGPTSPILFVVAAGNDGLPLGNRGTKYYPAIYGGPESTGAPNVITVAAMEPGLQELAPFSNYGSKYVEVGAPGCAIPVLSFDPNSGSLVPKRYSGTSMATPIVSFAASLIRVEQGGGYSPSLIKRRLLASSNLNVQISEKIVDGRTLDIAKAISLFDDVLELEGSGERLYGKASFRQDGRTLSGEEFIKLDCSPAESIQADRVLKIWPHYRDNLMKIYFSDEDSSSVMRSRECNISSSLAIEMKVDNEASINLFELDAIKDLVMSR